MANEMARTLRKRPTDAERKLWYALRHLKSDGFHFRRQVPIDQFIADFACLSQRLIVEVDGSQHNTPEGLRADAKRKAHLLWQGFTVIRFTNTDVLTNLTGVMQLISDEIGLTRQLQRSPLTPTPTPPRKGEGLSVDTSNERFMDKNR